VLRNFRVNVLKVNVSSVITRENNDFHSSQDSAGRIGAVRTGRNKTDISVVISS
jgi:hypothetical protein